MSDLISRQAVIEAIKRAIWDKYTAKDAIDAVCNIPSAQTERKKGRWIRMYYSRPKQYTRICSECKEISWFCGIGDYNYCPWCGAKMEGEEG